MKTSWIYFFDRSNSINVSEGLYISQPALSSAYGLVLSIHIILIYDDSKNKIIARSLRWILFLLPIYAYFLISKFNQISFHVPHTLCLLRKKWDLKVNSTSKYFLYSMSRTFFNRDKRIFLKGNHQSWWSLH